MYSLTRTWIDFPARQDADQRQQRRQQHEEQRDAVDAQVVADVEAGDPVELLDELHAGAGRRRSGSTASSETRKVASDVTSATRGSCARPPPCGQSTIRQNSAPTSGRKVTSDRIGQLAHRPTSPQHEVQRDEHDHADEHREGIVVEVAGLQRAERRRPVQATRGGDAVGGETRR